MSEAALLYIEKLIQGMGIPYQFMRWNNTPETPLPDDYYFIGDYIEEVSNTREENGFQPTTFILRGFTRKNWRLLEQAKAKIEKSIAKTAILEDGSGIAIFYGHASPVPTGDMDLKSIKINLQVQEWRVR